MTNTFVLPEHTRFPLGSLYVTVTADATLPRKDIAKALARHAQGDWGEVEDDDRRENEFALTHGERLFSVYYDHNGVKFWIITERDRSATTVLVPDDY